MKYYVFAEYFESGYPTDYWVVPETGKTCYEYRTGLKDLYFEEMSHSMEHGMSLEEWFLKVCEYELLVIVDSKKKALSYLRAIRRLRCV